MKEIVKGFKDYSGEEARKKAEIRKILVETFEKHGFEPAETPIIEYEEFVKGENSDDEVISDIFKLKDKGNRDLAMRYEFTFQLNRLAKNKKLPYKRYQIGEVFRDEPISSKRFRQFTQCDVDVVSSTIRDEAEILAMSYEVLEKLGIEPVILINNRKLMNEILDNEGIKQKESVLREIDKYDKLGEKQAIKNLKKYKAEKVLGILKQNPEFFRKYKSFSEIEELIKYCKIYGVDVLFSPTVVRGLSYYNGNVFEIKITGIKETLAAGGSYLCGETQATGISFGLERLMLVSKIKSEDEKTLIISLNQDKKAIEIAQKLRKKNHVASIYYGKPSKALEYADSYNFQKVIFVGSKEIKAKKFKIKDMKTGKESLLKI
jgi:histidyl-tRNA synthetase